MNKKLLTAAVVAALSASPAVFADATVYGKIDIGVQSVSPGSGYSGSKLFVNDTQGSGGSLIGFRVAEDIGGGMKGIATAEAGAFTDTGNLDNAANTTTGVLRLFQRQMWGGLTGGFGTITGGRQYREIFLTGNRYAYAYTNANIGVFFLNANTGVRQDNMIKYVSPNLSGLHIEVGYAPGEGTDPTGADKKNDQFSEFSANWSAGPLALGAAFGTSTAEAASVENKEKTTIAGGSYAFDPFKVYALYSKSKNDVSASAANRTAFSLNGVYTMGPGDIILAIGTTKSDATGASNDKSKLIALAYYYHLSKATTAYASYGSLSNDPGARQSLARQAVATTANGEDPHALSFGVVTVF